MTVQTTHAAQLDLEEVDIESDDRDHLGDYVERQSPYEASVAAQSLANVLVPDEAHDDPGEVRDDVARFAARPYAVAPVRVTASDSWAANDFLLVVGENRAVQIAEHDPYRKVVTIYNNTNDVVFISPNPNGTPGWGSSMIPAGGNRPITTKAPVWLFTVAGYNPGATQNVSAISERYA